jgi:hypothetical protein
MFTTAAYVMTYFFLTCFLCCIFAISSSDLYTSSDGTACNMPVVLWYQVSIIFYVFAFFTTLGCAILFKQRPLTQETVTLKQFIIVFNNLNANWYYLLLTAIELGHLSLTISGTVMSLNENVNTFGCYLELPMMTNFMYVLILLGYVYCLRFVATLVHFKFGIYIYRFLRNNLRCLRSHDMHLQDKFPLYSYSRYLQLMGISRHTTPK